MVHDSDKQERLQANGVCVEHKNTCPFPQGTVLLLRGLSGEMAGIAKSSHFPREVGKQDFFLM